MTELEKLTIWKPRVTTVHGREFVTHRISTSENKTNERRNAAATCLEEFDWWHHVMELRRKNSIWSTVR